MEMLQPVRLSVYPIVALGASCRRAQVILAVDYLDGLLWDGPGEEYRQEGPVRTRPTKPTFHQESFTSLVLLASFSSTPPAHPIGQKIDAECTASGQSRMPCPPSPRPTPGSSARLLARCCISARFEGSQRSELSSSFRSSLTPLRVVSIVGLRCSAASAGMNPNPSKSDGWIRKLAFA